MTRPEQRSDAGPTADQCPRPAAFDANATTYERSVNASISFTGRNAEFFAARKVAILHELLKRRSRRLSEMSVLDVGCGTGLTDGALSDRVRCLEGVDVSSEMVSVARRRLPGVRFQAYDGHTLPYSDERFDLAIAVCMLHHVPPAHRPDLMREMARVVRRGAGYVAIFEHNPLNPLTQHAVRSCELDSDATLLRLGEAKRLIESSAMTVEERRYCLFTPLAGGVAEAIDRWCRWLPFGGQYVVLGCR